MENKSIEVVSNLRKGIMGVTITTNTEPKMNKTNNPYYGRVRKLTVYTNARLGVDYENVVNNRLEREGMEREFVASAPKGKRWYNAFFYQSLKDEGVFYLKIGIFPTTEKKSTYFVDGVMATDEQVKEIKSFMPSKNFEVKSQSDAGLDPEKQYHIEAPLWSNVVAISIGMRVIE